MHVQLLESGAFVLNYNYCMISYVVSEVSNQHFVVLSQQCSKFENLLSLLSKSNLGQPFGFFSITHTKLELNKMYYRIEMWILSLVTQRRIHHTYRHPFSVC